jgi:nucleotidyltransferase substrate binding protein (TIGR01987 family)
VIESSRWQQRFSNFTKSFKLLYSASDGKQIDDFDDLQQEGLVQRFQYNFELLWKTLKDYLEYQDVQIEIISPKNVIKVAAASNLLELIGINGEILLDMANSRNLLSHTYDGNEFKKILIKIKKEYLPEMKKIHDYFAVQKK